MPEREARLMLVTFSLQTGGAERVLAAMANFWSEGSRDIALVTLTGPEGDFYPLHEDVRRIPLGVAAESHNRIEALAWNARRIRALRRTIKQERPGTILSFLPMSNVLTILSATGLGMPVVVSERVDPRHGPIRTEWSLLRRALYRRAAAVVIQTEELRSWAQRIAPSSLIRVIPNPVTVREPHPAHRSIAGPLVVGMGRLYPAKGFDLLIRAFAQTAHDHDAWRLTIWGEGPERPNLERLVRHLDMADRITLPGITHDPAAAFVQADLFVLSSRVEGFPNVLLEAMACGLPVIAFDCPTGPRDIVRNGTDGLLVPPGDVNQLALTMHRLMLDQSERSRLGSNALEVRRRFDLASVMTLWDDLLAEVTARSTASSRKRGRAR